MQALATHLRLAFLGKDPENLTHSRVRIAQAIHLSGSGETNKSPFETAFQAKLTAAVLIQKYHEASLGYDSSIMFNQNIGHSSIGGVCRTCFSRIKNNNKVYLLSSNDA